MDIKDIKDLEKLIKLCRKTGVEAIEVGNIKMNLGSTPVIYKNVKPRKQKDVTAATMPNHSAITADTKIITDELTDEQKLFWSSAPADNVPFEQGEQ